MKLCTFRIAVYFILTSFVFISTVEHDEADHEREEEVDQEIEEVMEDDVVAEKEDGIVKQL